MIETQITRQASDFHWLRRIWHFLGVMAMFILYLFLAEDEAFQLALAVSAFLVSLDVIRLVLPDLNKRLIAIFGPFLRTHETHRLTAATFMLIGVTVIIAFFPKDVVLLSLLMLAFADPLAAIVGIRFGKDKLIGKKTLQGALAAFTICAALGLIYYFYYGYFSDRLLLATILTGLIGALSELIPVYSLDDNLTFPIISSSLIYGLFYLFGAL
jgi:diacylglycerol kinase (CTP)